MHLLNEPQIDNKLSFSLALLNNENRLITTPWSRIVRGLGLGQYPIVYDEKISGWIQDAFEELKIKTNLKNNYTNFSSLLSDFICLLIKPNQNLSKEDYVNYIENIIYLINHEFDPYCRIMQYCIAIDALAKLNINLFNFLDNKIDLGSILFDTIHKIRAGVRKDENREKYGEYEKLSAYTSVFFSLAVCNKAELAINDESNHIADALKTLHNIPSPFFRGRGGSMLFSAIALMGHAEMLGNPDQDYILQILDYLDRAKDIGISPSFPQRMTPAFINLYPLLTMLNAIAATGHNRALNYRQDRILQAKNLMDELTPIERTHMGLYYIMAINNLGLLDREKNYINMLIEELIATIKSIDLSENYFLNGIAGSYVIETAKIVGKGDCISEKLIQKISDCFSKMDGKLEDKVNRPYPFAYALTMLGELGYVHKLFEPSVCYENRSATSWMIDNLVYAGEGVDSRLYMFNHALINLMLRMRGNTFPQLTAYKNFLFQADERQLRTL